MTSLRGASHCHCFLLGTVKSHVLTSAGMGSFQKGQKEDSTEIFFFNVGKAGQERKKQET